MSLSVVLTCYNEVPLIFDSYRKLSAHIEVSTTDHEFIIVDDGSTANVQRALKEYFCERNVKLILSELNEGRGAAVTKGIRAASKDYVGFIDTDLEIPPYSLLVLHHTAVALDADIVIAERVYKWDRHPRHLIRTAGSILLRFTASKMLDLENLDTETGAKVFRRRSITEVLDTVLSKRWFWDTEIIVEARKRSQRIVEVPIVVTRRSDKGSTVRPLRDAWKYFLSILAYKRRKRD